MSGEIDENEIYRQNSIVATTCPKSYVKTVQSQSQSNCYTPNGQFILQTEDISTKYLLWIDWSLNRRESYLLPCLILFRSSFQSLKIMNFQMRSQMRGSWNPCSIVLKIWMEILHFYSPVIVDISTNYTNTGGAFFTSRISINNLSYVGER